jgi:uncharacterized protein (TIGR02246 family)
MPRTPRILLALALASGLAFTPARPADEDAARAFALAWVAAYNAHDGAALARLYADGAVVTWPGGGGLVVEDRAAFEAGSAAWHAAHPSDHLDLAATHVRLVGADGAVVKLEGTGRFGPDGALLRGSVLLVLERAGGAWRVAAEHWMEVSAEG